MIGQGAGIQLDISMGWGKREHPRLWAALIRAMAKHQMMKMRGAPLPSPHTLLALCLSALLAAAAPAAAQPDFGFGGGDDEIVVRAVAQRDAAHPGGEIVVAVVIDHADGFHTWPNEPVLPQELADFPTTPTLIDVSVDPPGGAAVGPIQWPEPKPTVVNYTGEPLEILFYEGEAVAFVPLRVSRGFEGDEVAVTLKVSYQACDDMICLPPTDEWITLRLAVLPAGSELPGENEPALFEGFDSALFEAIDDAPAAPAQEPVEEAAAPTISTRSFFGIPVPAPTTAAGLVVLGLLSALGGLILNLTPCVLPVIPIKVMTLSQHAGTRGKALYLGVWMALGVVAFWVAIGIPAALFAAFSDPSQIFGIWWVTLTIGLLIAAMALGLMGMFAISLPQSAYMVNPKADNAWGSFLFGVMTGVLGLPCFGFVAGALLAGSAAFPVYVVLTIFACIGVGMAAPYLVLAAKPGLIERIPRTGPASELIKQVMGLLLLAAAVYFIGAGLIALVIEHPYIGRRLHWWTIAAIVTVASLWLIVRVFQISRSAVPRVVFSGLGVALSALALMFAVDTTRQARSSWEVHRAALAEAGPGGLITSAWMDYNTALFERAIDEGYTVVLDFTAEWCLNCKALKAAVLDREPVRSLLMSDDVVAMTVDLTNRNAPEWGKLRNELGQTGIPLLAVYGPSLDEPWLSNAYTPEQVVTAITSARGSSERTAAAGGRADAGAPPAPGEP